MKAFLKTFAFRGLVSAWAGPLVLAIIYGVLGAADAVTALSPQQVCLGIITVTALTFLVAGMGAIYQLEQLPLCWAILIHGAVLYIAYGVIYLVNGWIKRQLIAFAVFTGVFIAGYGLIWLLIYWVTRKKAKKMNIMLKNKR